MGPDNLQLHSKFKASLCWLQESCLKTQVKQNKQKVLEKTFKTLIMEIRKRDTVAGYRSGYRDEKNAFLKVF